MEHFSGEKLKYARTLQPYSELPHASSARCPPVVSSLCHKGSKGNNWLGEKKNALIFYGSKNTKNIKNLNCLHQDMISLYTACCYLCFTWRNGALGKQLTLSLVQVVQYDISATSFKSLSILETSLRISKGPKNKDTKRHLGGMHTREDSH